MIAEDLGHYKCLFLSSGSFWMADDDRRAALCLVMDPIRREAYIYRLVPHACLNMRWCRSVAHMGDPSDFSDLLFTTLS